MNEQDSGIAQLLERINTALGTDYRLRGRYSSSENHGAYKLEDAAGTPFVLKAHNDEAILPRLLRARAVTARLRELEIPAPAYVHIGTQGGRVYWLQSALPGEPPETLSAAQVGQLLEYNARQAGQAISNEQNWSWYVRAVVFAGESGWVASLRGHSAATCSLLGRLERLTAGEEASPSRRDDLVHGDLCLSNVLVASGRVSGVVDWDAAGCGDRALDLAKLLFYSFEQADIRALLWSRIVDISVPDALTVYLSYITLAQLDWSIHHHGLIAVTTWVARAEAMLDVLESAC